MVRRTRLSRKLVEQIAYKFLKILDKEGIRPPFDNEKLKKIAEEHLGIKVNEISMGYYFIDDDRLPLEEQYPIDGELVVMGDRVLIRLNKDRPVKRANFTLAHELGHYLLHYQLGVKKIPKDTMYTFNRKVAYDPMEREANWFAVALLMPEDMIRSKWAELENSGLSLGEKIVRLAEEFNVSQLAMKYRLQELGLINENIW